MRHLRKGLLFAFVLSLWSLALPASATHFFSDRVFTMSNAADGNEILMYRHHPFFGLIGAGRVATGGNGSGGGLGNQDGLIVSADKQWLYAINAGSNSISVFRIHRFGIVLAQTVDSGGIQPVSLTRHGDLLYVVNAGNDAIAGFTVEDGYLLPLDNSIRALSGSGTAPAQISFTPWGDMLIVTEKNTNLIATFLLNDEGVAESTVFNFSTVATPFGFGFDRYGHALITEAAGGAPDASVVSSYEIEEDGTLTVLDGGVATTESAACWLVTSRNGTSAFVTNTGSGTISAFKVNRRGDLRLTTKDGVTASTGEGTAPIDMALSPSGRFLFALASGSIISYRVIGDKHLRNSSRVGNIPASATGLVAF
jgi:6-phosphogluconolactonase (cycloisomerase 2 family)